MVTPVIKTYYLTSSIIGSWGGLSETAPALFMTPTSWQYGKNNPPIFSEMNYGVEILRNNTGLWKAAPSQSVPNLNAGITIAPAYPGYPNSFVIGPLTGIFNAGNWQITTSLQANTSAGNGQSRLLFRLWKGSNISGSDATLLNTDFITGSTIAAWVDTATLHRITASSTLPRITFNNEYLFFAPQFDVVVSSTAAVANDAHIWIGSNEGKITTALFTDTSVPATKFMSWYQDEI